MAFTMTPATGFPAVAPEAIDVACIDFTGDPDKVQVTRGVGENAHIITVRMNPSAPACLPLFLDNFDGAASTLVTAHVPDIFPAGFVWGTATPSNILDGAGRAVPNPANLAGQNRAPFSGVTPMPVGSDFVLTLVGRMPG